MRSAPLHAVLVPTAIDDDPRIAHFANLAGLEDDPWPARYYIRLLLLAGRAPTRDGSLGRRTPSQLRREIGARRRRPKRPVDGAKPLICPIGAMREAGLLLDKEGEFLIADWPGLSGKYVVKRQQSQARMARMRNSSTGKLVELKKEELRVTLRPRYAPVTRDTFQEEEKLSVTEGDRSSGAGDKTHVEVPAENPKRNPNQKRKEETPVDTPTGEALFSPLDVQVAIAGWGPTGLRDARRHIFASYLSAVTQLAKELERRGASAGHVRGMQRGAVHQETSMVALFVLKALQDDAGFVDIAMSSIRSGVSFTGEHREWAGVRGYISLPRLLGADLATRDRAFERHVADAVREAGLRERIVDAAVDEFVSGRTDA